MSGCKKKKRGEASEAAKWESRKTEKCENAFSAVLLIYKIPASDLFEMQQNS